MTDPKNTGKFGPGNPGKPKGAKNKTTKLIREMIVEALDGAGGVSYLQKQADEHPAAFLSLIGKVMPVQIEGAGGGAVKHSVKVTFG